ncbi:MAG: head-tail connector protein [Aliishimia sp.]
MMLIEETALPDATLPVEEFRAHLRLGSGFGDETLQDAVLFSFLRAAMSAIEARTGKILLERGFLWSLTKWQGVDVQALPVSPVRALNRVTLIAKDGNGTEVDLATLRLESSTQEARIIALGSMLPTLPASGSVDIRFTAGWGASWGDLPPDLAQAVLLLASHYYEFRSETSLSSGCMPFGVSSLLERYRPMRIGFGVGQ